MRILAAHQFKVDISKSRIETMAIETIYLSQKSKDQLLKLKRVTGIQNWNILCRWAFCYSLATETIPNTLPDRKEIAIEMAWKTFAGEQEEIYIAILKQWLKNKELAASDENIKNYFDLLLAKGIEKLSSNKKINRATDLLSLAS